MSDNYVGKNVVVRGLTLRGKNRVNRGGDTYHVVTYSDRYGYFLRSVRSGDRECFWAQLPHDPHVVVQSVRGRAA